MIYKVVLLLLSALIAFGMSLLIIPVIGILLGVIGEAFHG